MSDENVVAAEIPVEEDDARAGDPPIDADREAPPAPSRGDAMSLLWWGEA